MVPTAADTTIATGRNVDDLALGVDRSDADDARPPGQGERVRVPAGVTRGSNDDDPLGHGAGHRPLQGVIAEVARGRYVDDRRPVVHGVVHEGRVRVLADTKAVVAVLPRRVTLDGKCARYDRIVASGATP